MAVTRRDVLEQLAAVSDAESGETTTVAALVAMLDADADTVEAYLDGLRSCELARIDSEGNVRVTVTAEELLALDTDEMVVVDPSPPTGAD